MNPYDLIHPITIITRDGPKGAMTIRDYIAIEAMKALVTLWHEGGDCHETAVSSRAYEYADAMIAESNKANDPA